MLLAGTFLFICFVNSARGFQGPVARDGGTAASTPTPKRSPQKGTSSPTVGGRGGGTVKPPPARVTQLTLIVPPGCRIWLNDVPVETSLIQDLILSIDGHKVTTSERAAGVIALNGIRPGTYQLVARKPDFREYTTTVTVTLEAENVLTVSLTPISGKLTVLPSVQGAEVEIVSLVTNLSVGHYSERLDQFEIPSGQYRIVTSKAGYKNAIREIRVNPGESIYLEPLLELLPSPTPTTKSAPLVAPLTFDVHWEGKYIIFHFQGSSGDAGKMLGSINVLLNGPERNSVTGNLSGLPCQVEIIKLENIAEASIVQAPGPADNWTSMVVRVRPKDEKRRPISFAINWRSLTNASPSKPDTQVSGSISAQAIRKVQPKYPLAARNSNASGRVLVRLIIDTGGSVVSAKAIEGPAVFRQVSEDAARQWKFRPATRDSQAIESEQIIEFRFGP